MKQCPECQTLVFTATTICPECGHEFDIRRGRPDHDEVPDEDAIILSGDSSSRIQRWAVTKVLYSRHSKPGKPPSMRVTYVCGPKLSVSEWVCFEHGGYARVKAEQWWRARLGKDPIPEDVSSALARVKCNEITNAVSITVDTVGKYPEIKGVRFEDEASTQVEKVEPAPATIDYGDIPR